MERLRIDPTGQALQTEAPTRPRRYLAWYAVAWAGLVLLVAVFIAPDPSGIDWQLFAFFAAFALIAMGSGIAEDRLTELVRSRAAGDEWLEFRSLVALEEAATMSYAQLAALEKLTAEHGQIAVFREHGDGSIEVVTEADSRLERRIVAPSGEFWLSDWTGVTRGWKLKRRAQKAYGGRWTELDFRPSD